MKEILKAFIKKTPLYRPLRTWLLPGVHQKELENWKENGQHGPSPHLIKQQTLIECANTYGLKILVETGTFMGDMVAAMNNKFELVYSIELNEELYKGAKKRFVGNKRVKIIQGDSGIELGNLMKIIDQPALFWLDGHYSSGVTAKGINETPIFEELTHIFSAPDRGHVIVIDDARLFGTDPSYPDLDELQAFIRTNRPDAGIAIENDSIRITPGKVAS